VLVADNPQVEVPGVARQPRGYFFGPFDSQAIRRDEKVVEEQGIQLIR
jgi:hypothetical protein